MYATSNVGLISLVRGLAHESVPSKFYTILSSGRPVVASVDAGNDVVELIQEAGCGVRVDAEDPAAVADALESLYHDPDRARAMGRAGRSYVERNYDRKQVARLYEQALLDAVTGSGRSATQRLGTMVTEVS